MLKGNVLDCDEFIFITEESHNSNEDYPKIEISGGAQPEELYPKTECTCLNLAYLFEAEC